MANFKKTKDRFWFGVSAGAVVMIVLRSWFTKTKNAVQSVKPSSPTR